jgi:uncharacterized protein YrrD
MEEKFVIEKKAKRILIISMILIIAPAIMLIYWKGSHTLSGTDLILKNGTDEAFHGRVDSIYFDERNHNVETLILSDGYVYGLFKNWHGLVNVGDSLSKEAGSFNVMVYKHGVLVNILDYKKLVKNFE